MAVQGEAVCAALRGQVEKLGLSLGDEPRWAGLSFAETRDPFSQEVSLVGTWRGGERYGTLTFFPDGRLFAEYQVLQPHPALAGWYVEAVQVWGRPGQLRGDAVLGEYAR
ncbi:MAG TPA: hypothetical protein VF096_14515 [Azonexus sp.]